MPAYAYPIKVDRERQTIKYTETFELCEESLTLDMLAPIIGPWKFDVSSNDYGDITVTVYKSRQETDEELEARVAREEVYMAEYNKRNSK